MIVRRTQVCLTWRRLMQAGVDPDQSGPHHIVMQQMRRNLHRQSVVVDRAETAVVRTVVAPRRRRAPPTIPRRLRGVRDEAHEWLWRKRNVLRLERAVGMRVPVRVPVQAQMRAPLPPWHKARHQDGVAILTRRIVPSLST